MSDVFHSEIGQLILILGPMFSGKSTSLLHEITTLADVGLKAIYINHEDDQRITASGSENVTTHHSSFSDTSEIIDTISVKSLSKVDVQDYDVVAHKF